MKEFLCTRYFVYAVSLLISLALSLYRPDVKDVLCTVFPIDGFSDRGGRYQNPQPQQSEEMTK
jgi:hypothetical protein